MALARSIQRPSTIGFTSREDATPVTSVCGIDVESIPHFYFSVPCSENSKVFGIGCVHQAEVEIRSCHLQSRYFKDRFPEIPLAINTLKL